LHPTSGLPSPARHRHEVSSRATWSLQRKSLVNILLCFFRLKNWLNNQTCGPYNPTLDRQRRRMNENSAWAAARQWCLACGCPPATVRYVGPVAFHTPRTRTNRF